MLFSNFNLLTAQSECSMTWTKHDVLYAPTSYCMVALEKTTTIDSVQPHSHFNVLVPLLASSSTSRSCRLWQLPELPKLIDNSPELPKLATPRNCQLVISMGTPQILSHLVEYNIHGYSKFSIGTPNFATFGGVRSSHIW